MNAFNPVFSSRGILLLLVFALALPTGQAEAKKKRQPLKGKLAIESMIDGIKIYIDGKAAGKTPLNKPLILQAGKHKLKATKPGYSTLELEVRIRARRTENIMVDLVPHSGLVRFKSNVKNAEVYVDGRMLGHTPLIQEVPVGDHKVQIVLEGYNDFIAEMNVKAGEKHFVEAVLTPFQDFSPEILAIQAKAEKQAQEDATRQAAAEEEAQRLAIAPAQKQADSTAPSWTDDWYKKWWIWTIAGAVLVTAVTVPLAVSGGGQAGLEDHLPTATIHLNP